MRIVGAGEIGELYVAGKHIAAGYVKGRDAFRFVESPHAVDPGKLTCNISFDCALVLLPYKIRLLL